MPVPKEQPPRKLSGDRTVVEQKTLERGAKRCIRRRDNDLRQKDRGGIHAWRYRHARNADV